MTPRCAIWQQITSGCHATACDASHPGSPRYRLAPSFDKGKLMRLLIAVLLVFSAAIASAQDTVPVNINNMMMEATCKVFGPGSSGSGFILGTPDPKDSKFSFFTLITAHHVLQDVQGDHAVLVLRRLIDREKQEYQRIEVPVEIRKNGTALWSKHPDVDLAAMFVSLPSGAAPTVIPISLLFTDEKIKKFDISPGTELFCLGYPFGAEATPLGFAILRSGKIASYPLLPTTVTKTFLFDFTVFRGNSGGPVYLYEKNPIYGGSTHIGTIQGVMGIITAERNIKQRIEQLYEKRETITPLALGEVIHASFIKDLVSRMPLPLTTK